VATILMRQSIAIDERITARSIQLAANWVRLLMLLHHNLLLLV
jgi:hypothetical protein